MNSMNYNNDIRPGNFFDNKPKPGAEDVESNNRTSRNSFRKLLKEFAGETSFGGISKIASSQNIIQRILWTLISATCYGFTIYMTIGLIRNYMSKPISTTIDISHEKNIEFPAITVCNLNRFRHANLSLLDDLPKLLKWFSGGKKKNESGEFSTKLEGQKSAFKKKAALNSNTEDDEGEINDDEIDDKSILEYVISSYIDEIDMEKLKMAGHQFDQLVHGCTWMGLDCKTGYFSKFWKHSWNWVYGNCYMFNAGVNKSGGELSVVRTSMPGPSYGLALDLNIEQNQYIDELTDEAGVKIVVHNAKQMPFPYDEGITVPPGFSTSIGIRKETVQRVDPFNNGSCQEETRMASENLYSGHYNGARMKYSVKACMKSCLAREQMSVCNCSGIPFLKLRNMCKTDEEFTCLSQVDAKYKNNEIDCAKECPQPCLQEAFSSSYMMSALSANKKKKAKQDMNNVNVDENFIRLQVYYEKLNLQQITQSVNYGIESLLGDIGGTLGLWVGISAISIAEFGELIISLFVVAFRKSRGQKATGIELSQK